MAAAINIDTLKDELLIARKNGNTIAKGVLATLIGDIERRISNKSSPDIVQLMKKYISNAKSNMDIEHNRGNAEMAQSYLSEAIFLGTLLPTQLSENDLQHIINEQKPANIGVLMKFLNENYRGQFDGQQASKLAKEYIKNS